MLAALTGAPVYLTYFGLSEAPFSTTPDQRFLYLSERHREGVAHLLYGIAERGGFLQLTGEVGTGKTTLCRYLLDHLPPHVDVALILNPMLTRAELLATICDELRIAYRPGTQSLKVFIDALHAYLLDAHARGRRTIVIVDEAQNLSVEVLEQLRLLTNLETAKAKLLQIILVGQPELIELLRRTDLRQVAQRVAARYHLKPLLEIETRAYVAHRLAMAGSPTVLFDDAAIRAVYRASAGVPRVVNVLCDRALLGAYAKRTERVTAALVRRAAREIAGEASKAHWPGRRRAVAIAAAAALVIAAGSAVVASGRLDRWAITVAPAPPPAASVPMVPVAAPPPPEPAARTLSELLQNPSFVTDPDAAFAAVAARWGKTYERQKLEAPCDALRRIGLECLARRGTWKLVRRFDLPAVLEVNLPGTHHFLAVTAADDRRATLEAAGRTESVTIEEIGRVWDGGFTVVWRPPRPGIAAVGPAASGGDIVWLRQRLASLEGDSTASSRGSGFDQDLAERIAAFQRAHALDVDGIAGAETLAKLTTVLDPAAPALGRPRTGS